MNIFYIWMIVEIVLLAINVYILHKYQDQLTYQPWVDIYFWMHKITTALPGIILGWAGYIYLYDFFNSWGFYQMVYVRELTILSGYFVIVFLLLYLGGNARRIYAAIRVALVALNIYQVYYLWNYRQLLTGFDISRNIFRYGSTSGLIILVCWGLIELVNCLVFIYYYKYNRYEMTN